MANSSSKSGRSQKKGKGSVIVTELQRLTSIRALNDCVEQFHVFSIGCAEEAALQQAFLRYRDKCLALLCLEGDEVRSTAADILLISKSWSLDLVASTAHYYYQFVPDLRVHDEIEAPGWNTGLAPYVLWAATKAQRVGLITTKGVRSGNEGATFYEEVENVEAKSGVMYKSTGLPHQYKKSPVHPPPYDSILTIPIPRVRRSSDEPGEAPQLEYLGVLNITTSQPYDFSYEELAWAQACASLLGSLHSSHYTALERLLGELKAHPNDKLIDLYQQLHPVPSQRVDSTPKPPSSIPRLHRPLNAKSEGHSSEVDIALITVIPEEYHAVRQLIENKKLQDADEIPNRYSWETGEIPSTRHSAPYQVVIAFAGAAGTGAGLLATMETVKHWKPRYALLVGIAGGIQKNNVNLGDVVISSHIWGYEYGKMDAGKFAPRQDHTFQVDSALLNAAVSFSVREPNWSEKISEKKPSPDIKPTLRSGPVASGEKVVDDLSHPAFAPVLKAWPKLMAVEMEGLGAAHAITNLRDAGQTVGMLMIRGISDVPNSEAHATVAEHQGQQRESWKKYAAAAAAQFSADFIRNGWPVKPYSSKLNRAHFLVTVRRSRNEPQHRYEADLTDRYPGVNFSLRCATSYELSGVPLQAGRGNLARRGLGARNAS